MERCRSSTRNCGANEVSRGVVDVEVTLSPLLLIWRTALGPKLLRSGEVSRLTAILAEGERAVFSAFDGRFEEVVERGEEDEGAIFGEVEEERALPFGAVGVEEVAVIGGVDEDLDPRVAVTRNGGVSR